MKSTATMVKSYSYYLLFTVLSLVVAGPSCSDKNKNTDNECSETNKNGTCPAQFLCNDGTCRKICDDDSACEKYQSCTGNFCFDVTNPFCTRDEDCKLPGQCEIIRDAYCEAGKCHYAARAAGEPCNDDNNCTVDDQCDGQGKCIGSDRVCNTPPDNFCDESDSKYSEYSAVGNCVVGGNDCNYTLNTRDCPNCLVACKSFCEGVICPVSSIQCKQYVCDSKSTDTPPCSLINEPKSTACQLGGGSDNGYCDEGTCYECTEDSHCTAYPNIWADCYEAKCSDHKCVYSVKDVAAQCGGKCLEGNSYIKGKCGSAEQNGVVVATCSAAATSCNGYVCENEDFCRETCDNNEHCTPDYFCRAGRCVSKMANGEAGCSADYMCQSSHCDQATDVGPEMGRCCAAGECCDANSDCGDDDVCRNYGCTSEAVGRSCANDNDCNSKTFCNTVTSQCEMKKDLGLGCGGDNECNGYKCVDGVCCGSESCGLCESCAIAGYPGECHAVAAGESDDTCPESSGLVCSENKKCLKRRGQECSLTNECYESNCVDKVCCGDASCKICEACNLEGFEGTCTFVGEGQNDDTCNAIDDKLCKASGSCLKVNGQAAKNAAECYSGYLADGVCCDSACDNPDNCKNSVTTIYGCALPGNEGTCSSKNLTCDGTACNSDGTACLGSCTANSDCTDNKFCNYEGKCKDRLIEGETCAVMKSDSVATSCVSGYCTDGYCCTTDNCPSSCQNNMLTEFACNGANGTCAAKGAATACPGNLVCENETACKEKCSQDADCLNDTYCANGTCVAKKENGELSDFANQCKSGIVTDGRCCSVAMCENDCDDGYRFTPYACGASGNCEVKSKTTDCADYFACADAHSCRESCGINNDCKEGYYCAGNKCYEKKNNGAESSDGEQCKSGYAVDNHCCSVASCTDSCTGSTKYHSVCNNQGVCALDFNNPEECADHLKCATSQTCKTSCSINSDCVDGYYCDSTDHKCYEKKNNGAESSDGNQCKSGFAVDNHCCSVASCPNDSCLESQLSHYTCGSTGTCTKSSTKACDFNLECADNYSCRESCSSDDDCADANAYFCDSGSKKCISKYAPGLICNGDNECAAGHCVDGICCSTACDTAQVCANGTITINSCESGNCKQVKNEVCAGALACNAAGNDCLSSCTTNNDCVSNDKYCDPSGICKDKLANGQVPASVKGGGSSSSCLSGYVSDGYCCDSACDTENACVGSSNSYRVYACNLPGQVGQCSFYDTFCGSPSCQNNTLMTPVCQGGACSTIPSECGNYVCRGSACLSQCSSDDDCADKTNYYCDRNTHKCEQRKALGVGCTSSAECGVGNYCTDGVCCKSQSCVLSTVTYQCSGSCMYKQLEGKCGGSGTCVNSYSSAKSVPAGKVCYNNKLVSPSATQNCGKTSSQLFENHCAVGYFARGCTGSGTCNSSYSHTNDTIVITDRADMGGLFNDYLEKINTPYPNQQFQTCGGVYNGNDYDLVWGYCNNGNFVATAGEDCNDEWTWGKACFEYENGTAYCEDDH